MDDIMGNSVKDLLENKKIENKASATKSKISKAKKILKTIFIFFSMILFLFILIGIFGNDEKESQEQSAINNAQTINSLIYSDLKLGKFRNEITEKLQNKGFVLWESYTDNECITLDFRADKNVIFEGYFTYEIFTQFDKNDKLIKCNIYFTTIPEYFKSLGFTDLNQVIELLKTNCFENQGFDNLEQVEQLSEALRKNAANGFKYTFYNNKDECLGFLRHTYNENGTPKLYVFYSHENLAISETVSE